MPHFQFDAVLQKENLRPHDQVHPAMYMPSHGEWLLEGLSRLGFKMGLVFGLDDFVLNGQTLNRSSSEIFIVCGADQHHTPEFLQTWKEVQRQYACRVLIVSEPIYSPLAFYRNSDDNAAVAHERFLATFKPDVILYLSRYDCLEARKRLPSGLKILLYSLADPELLPEPPIPWRDKEAQLLWLGKPQAWKLSWQQAQTGFRWGRRQQLDFFTQQNRYPFVGFSRQFTFRECYQVSNRFRFQLQPRSGYAFHSARTVQAAICGAIPVVLLPAEQVDLLQIEAPFAKPGQNLLLALDPEDEAQAPRAYAELLEQLHDEALCSTIAAHLPELLQAGSIQSGLRELGESIQTLL